MTDTNALLLQTLRGEQTCRPPIWFMRQAGRVLPRYNALKQQYSFKELMEQPRLAAEVTLMPIDDLGVDAAILFSDILVIPQAMGMDLHFPDTGPVFSNPLMLHSRPETLLRSQPEKLEYIYAVIDEIVKIKPNHIPLIGFCGSPFTVLLYMLQGLHGKTEFPDAIQYIYSNVETVKKILHHITELSIEYMRKQIQHGVDVFQLFDTHAGLIPFELYASLILPHVQTMCDAARELHIPFIFFPKGIGVGIQQITPEYCDFLSIDWQTPLHTVRALVHESIGLQGNIDPRILYASPEEITAYLTYYKKFGAAHSKWICNLGHGFMPGLDYSKAVHMVQVLKSSD